MTTKPRHQFKLTLGRYRLSFISIFQFQRSSVESTVKNLNKDDSSFNLSQEFDNNELDQV